MILGLHIGPHDSSAAIIENGAVLAMMEQERFDHNKHSGAFPAEAIAFCLAHVGARLNDLVAVASPNDVEVTNQYKSAFTRAAYPGAFHPEIYRQSDFEKILRAKLSFEGTLLHFDHHSGHAASVFLTSPFEESAIFTVDGMGNWITTTLAVGRGNSIETLERIAHPHSLGLFYGA